MPPFPRRPGFKPATDLVTGDDVRRSDFLHGEADIRRGRANVRSLPRCVCALAVPIDLATFSISFDVRRPIYFKLFARPPLIDGHSATAHRTHKPPRVDHCIQLPSSHQLPRGRREMGVVEYPPAGGEERGRGSEPADNEPLFVHNPPTRPCTRGPPYIAGRYVQLRCSLR